MLISFGWAQEPRNSLLTFLNTCIPLFKVNVHLCVCWTPFLSDLKCSFVLISVREEILHQVPSFDLLLSASVQYQSSLYGGNNNSASPPSSGGSSPIVCERCGQVCRGEVVRVKNTHFHVQCFTCQGKKKKKKKHSYTQTNTCISFLSYDGCLFYVFCANALAKNQRWSLSLWTVLITQIVSKLLYSFLTDWRATLGFRSWWTGRVGN